MGRRDQERARRAYEDMAARLAELDVVDGIELTPPGPHRPVPLSGQPPRGAGHWRRARSPFEPGTGRRGRVRRRRGGPGARTSALVACLVVVGLLWSTGAWQDLLASTGARSPALLGQGGPGQDLPPVPDDARDERLAEVVEPGTQGSYAFGHEGEDAQPVRFDPCRPLHYTVNPSGMPDGGLGLVREAVAQVSAASGLVFEEDGVTDEPLSTQREPLQRDRYGDRWAPVLIGWADAQAYPLLGGEIAGVGGSAAIAPTGPGSERLASGQVALDSQSFTEILARPDGFEQARAIVMHELAHVIGLAHVQDGTELMSASNAGQRTWGPGDRQGLAIAGAGPCHHDT